MNIVITGTGSKTGLGHRVALRLVKQGHHVIGLTRDVDFHSAPERYEEIRTDITMASEVSDAVSRIRKVTGEVPIDILVNNAGVNKLDMIPDIDFMTYDDVFQTNLYGMLNTVQAFLPQLIESKGTILNIVSSAANTPMTASFIYNCSKAAAQMGTQQMARELGRQHGITVFGINPNKLEGTGMSDQVEDDVMRVRGWTREYAREYQEKSLPAGLETDPEQLADFIAYLLDRKDRHKYLAGCMIPYGVQNL